MEMNDDSLCYNVGLYIFFFLLRCIQLNITKSFVEKYGIFTPQVALELKEKKKKNTYFSSDETGFFFKL